MIVGKAAEHSVGTIADRDEVCPFIDCNRVINGDEIKKQAQTGGLGGQLFAIVFKRRIATKTKAGKAGRDKWEVAIVRNVLKMTTATRSPPDP